MQDDYRFWYAGGISLLIGLFAYYGLIKPQAADLARVTEVVIQSAKELQTLKDFAQQKNADINSQALATAFAEPQKNKMDFFALLSKIAHQEKVVIHAMNMPVGLMASPHEMQIEVLVEGELSALLHFALAIMQQSQPVFIRHFSFQTSRASSLFLSLSLLMMKNNVAMLSPPSVLAPLSIERNPFCVPMNRPLNLSAQEEEALAKMPLAQLRMMGYLAEGARRAALIKLPTGAVIAVMVGEAIGKEKAMVREIVEDAIVVEEKEGKRKYIK